MTHFKKGDIVLYSPIMLPGYPKFGGVVREEPWQLGHGVWVTHVKGLGQAYREFVHLPDADTVRAACFEALELAPTLFRASDRTWHINDDDGHFDAEICHVSGWVVAFLETANIVKGFDSYEAARAAVEEICK